MHPEAAFLSGYALLLTAVAAGLGWVGRRHTDPWSSRMLAASRRSGEPRTDSDPAPGPAREHGPGWPHSEVRAFHHVVGIVALAAAMLLTMVSVVRHHGPVEVAVQVTLLVLVGTRITHLARRNRSERRAREPG